MDKYHKKQYSDISEVVKHIDPDAKEIRLLLRVTDYDAPYVLPYEVSLHLPAYCNAKKEVFDFLIRIDMLCTTSILEQKKTSYQI